MLASLALQVACGGSSDPAPTPRTANRLPIKIANAGAALTNYIVQVDVDTAALITDGSLDAFCANVAFADADTGAALSYYLESGCDTAATVFWVRVPSIAAASTKTVYLDHAYNPSKVNSYASSFADTFPNSYVLGSGSDTLTGAQVYDWFEVAAGATLTVTQGAPLQINARKILIEGVIDANGAGYLGQATTAYSDGAGPGAGQNITVNNGGGAGYGGGGGCAPAGGAGSCGQPGGVTYGTSSGTDLDMGSGGAAGTSIPADRGGNGGGQVELAGYVVQVGGTVRANGVGGYAASASSGGGGGGSGGGIMVQGEKLDLSGGTFSAAGGTAGNPYGGAAGGGRVKIFSNLSSVGSPTLSVAGTIATRTGGNVLLIAGYTPASVAPVPNNATAVGFNGTTFTGTYTDGAIVSAEPTITIDPDQAP